MKPALFLTVVILFLGLASGWAREGKSFLECRPCGPDAIKGPLRLLLFQGCAGADFRPACLRHDAGYDTPGADKAACDELFYEELVLEAANSTKPQKALRRAKMAYLGVKWFGGPAFRAAQKKAAG